MLIRKPAALSGFFLFFSKEMFDHSYIIYLMLNRMFQLISHQAKQETIKPCEFWGLGAVNQH
jgi:hypothetical protein